MAEQKRGALLVTGASGHLGRKVVELLLAANAGPIIATTRSPEQLADLAARGVEVRKADFDDASALPAAFAGAERMLLISTDVLGVPGHRITQHQAAVKAAEQAGVRHVVYTSLTRPEPGNPIAIAPDHYATEQALAASSMDWTVLRNNVYTEVLLRNLPRAVATGQFVSAGGEGKVGYVTRDDCARVAAAALNSDRSGRNTFEITGPGAVSHGDVAKMVSEITGKPVQYIGVSAEAMVDGMVQAGVPRGLAEVLVTFDVGISQGTLDVVSDAVTELTGQPPQSVYDFLVAQRNVLLGE